jgi:phage replication-related protein YjqB (UPF0714/DUF867 family)
MVGVCSSACAPVDDVDTTEDEVTAGAGDRYACVTTSQPGCHFGIGTGKSLIGAGECLANVDYNISSSDTNRAQPIIFAIHGGLIEDGTAQLADHLVAQLGWDHYIFRARAVSATCKETRWMHVTSGRFNSATARALAFSHPSAVSLHGYNENSADRANWPQDTWFICTGGDHATARALFTSSINTPAFSIDGRRVRAATCDGIEGTGDTNVVNLPPNHGLQIELPRHLRLSSSATLRTRLTRAIDAAL